MINQKALDGQAEFARKLNAGKFDALFDNMPPAKARITAVKLSGRMVEIPMDADGEAIVRDLADVAKAISSDKANTVETPMSLADEIIAYESGELNDDEIVAMFQRLVNTGLAWQLQGHYGRTAREMLNAGLISQP